MNSAEKKGLWAVNSFIKRLDDSFCHFMFSFALISLSWLSSKAVPLLISLLSKHMQMKPLNPASVCAVMSRIPHGYDDSTSERREKSLSVVLSAAVLCYQMEREGLDRDSGFHFQHLFHVMFLLLLSVLHAASCRSAMDPVCPQMEVSDKPL